jgi:aspartate--ammonia ligase
LLSKELDLMRVTAPLFVDPLTGLNDNLSGKENAVSFKIPSNKDLEIVQSLAKWKRYALNKYNADGIYTDMNAIRMHEDLDNIHSIYVDQWDWEKRITVNDRNISYLKEIVNKIYEVLKTTQKVIHDKFPALNNVLPDKIHYITSSELEDLYPDLSRKEREYEITKKYGAVFLIGIGNKLKDGISHDSRASDYDDWNLNGDLLVYYSTLDIALELSSMGIRVDKEALLHQLKEKKEEFKLDLPYHKEVLENTLPLTIGGGIGQSRICMYLLNKAHIGEVQVSYWNKEDIELFKRNNIHLL